MPLYCCFFFSTGCSEPELPATKEESAAFAKTLESSINKGSAAKFNEALDAALLKKRILEASNHKINELVVNGAVQEIKKGTLGKEIVEALGKSGSYELVKQYEKDNTQHLVFRLYADSKLNYHDMEVVKKRGAVKISDVFIYITGENLSATLAESTMLMTENIGGLSAQDQDRLNKIKKVRQLLNEGSYDRARSLYKDLPATLKQSKLFKMIYVQIASGLENDEYLKAMTDYQQAYPDAPNMYLLMMDAYILKAEYDKALQSVNKLDSLINKDPFLDYYRGLIYKAMGNKEKQRTHFELLDAHMPAFSDGTLELLVAYLDAGETDKAVALVHKRSRNYKKIDQEQRETLYTLYPDFKKKLDTAAD